MRKIVEWNGDWLFSKETTSQKEEITIPHTWNAFDGQDGGNDYFRGTCFYEKFFSYPAECEQDQEVWLEFEGVAMRAKVYLNDTFVGSHDGGYSTFRFPITRFLQAENHLKLEVDNAANKSVYPQKADFTFYGGIYRNVKLVIVPKTHFSLGYYGGNGVQVTTDIQKEDAVVTICSWIDEALPTTNLLYQIKDKEGNLIAEKRMQVDTDQGTTTQLKIPKVHLWNGISDPYLYQLSAYIISEYNWNPEDTDQIVDEVNLKFGCRTFFMDPEKGFFLNGESYRLCGVARHQDRLGVGSALTPDMHREDMELIAEMGANTIRLAHYQHDAYFYDLADEYGMIVWAEIPYISEHLPEARENTISQMKELIVQNYNHPSIVCWALSNEITASGTITEDLRENHRILNELCHKMDKTRPTSMAHVFMLDPDDPLVTIPDICSYNLYYGWYIGELSDNEKWLDEFHHNHPNQVIGLSEYGADANPQYQSDVPKKGDYTEAYQCIYHEHMLKMWQERPYLWSMQAWNMFDFAADGREEGGKPGQNQKGLVTFDRKTKKDAFYIYKAYLSKEPFVHICGKRYCKRVEEQTKIKVYTNQARVTLFVDDIFVEEQRVDKIVEFQIAITGKHRIKVISGNYEDTMELEKVKEIEQSYLYLGKEVTNWFDEDAIKIKEGYFSINDSVQDIKENTSAFAVYQKIMEKVVASYGDVAKNVTMPEEMQRKMDAMSLEQTLQMAGKSITPDMIIEVNEKLSMIPKEVIN